jgi:ParB/RepB/Spo0J family partition protein
MGERQFEALKQNIREFGFIVPVVADQNYVIADGEHRLRAANDLGFDSIPAVVLDVDDPDRRVLRQVMNKLAGDHDIHEDAREFEKILESSRSKNDLGELLGQSEKSIDGVLEMLDTDGDSMNAIADDGAGSTAASEGETATDAPAESVPSNEDLGSPDALDPDAMEFDHECPQCGYQWD